LLEIERVFGYSQGVDIDSLSKTNRQFNIEPLFSLGPMFSPDVQHRPVVQHRLVVHRWGETAGVIHPPLAWRQIVRPLVYGQRKWIGFVGKD